MRQAGPRAGVLRRERGGLLEPAELLGRGGEAQVFALRGDPHRAVKLYTGSDRRRTAKLRAMIRRPPAEPRDKQGRASLAWPEELILDSQGEAAGFVMPRFDASRYRAIHQLYNPASRRSNAPGITWAHLVRVARNLCAAVAALHDAGYVIGDLNDSNILVSEASLVALVDLDSIQVITPTHVFPCNVGRAEYLPPELQDRQLRNLRRRPAGDRFALAVLVFLLLMEGNHPFSGRFTGAGEPPGLVANISRRHSPYFGRSPLQPPLSAPPLELLSSEVRTLLQRMLLGLPLARPSARRLQEALGELEGELRVCTRNPAHYYREGLPACPWCERQARLGIDPFGSEAVARSPAVAAAPATRPAAHPRSGPGAGSQRGTPVTRSSSPAAPATPPPPRAAAPRTDRPGKGAREHSPLDRWPRTKRVLAVTVRVLRSLLAASVLTLVVGLTWDFIGGGISFVGPRPWLVLSGLWLLTSLVTWFLPLPSWLAGSSPRGEGRS